MAKSYSRSKGRGADESFLAVPKRVLNHRYFPLLSAYSIKLLFDLGSQYNGFNNGDLCATWSIMREKGWRSKSTLSKSIKELVHYKFIVMTQIGGLNKPSLYGLVWKKLDKAKKESGWSQGKIPGICRETIQPFALRKKGKCTQRGSVATPIDAVPNYLALVTAS